MILYSSTMPGDEMTNKKYKITDKLGNEYIIGETSDGYLIQGENFDQTFHTYEEIVAFLDQVVERAEKE